jgi:hypothetical protein
MSMLRQALDAAVEQGVLPSSTAADAERASLSSQQSGTSRRHDYGATLNDDENDEGDDDGQYSVYEDTDGSLTTGGDGFSTTTEEPTAPISFVGKTYQKAHDFVWIIANVDNLWDSPNPDHYAPPRRNKLVVLFWFFLLALAYAVERSTFKFLVDRVGPFRLFSIEVVTFTHAFLLGMGMMLGALHRRKLNFKQPLGVPLVDVGRKFVWVSFNCFSLWCQYLPFFSY